MKQKHAWPLHQHGWVTWNCKGSMAPAAWLLTNAHAGTWLFAFIAHLEAAASKSTGDSLGHRPCVHVAAIWMRPEVDH